MLKMVGILGCVGIIKMSKHESIHSVVNTSVTFVPYTVAWLKTRVKHNELSSFLDF